MNLQLNWKQIVLKVQNKSHQVSKNHMTKQKQLHQHLNHHLVSKLKLRDSICKRIRMQNAKLKTKLQQEMREKRNKSQAIQAAKLQRQNQYQLHSRYLKHPQKIISNTEIMKRSQSFIHQIQENKCKSSSKESQSPQKKHKQAIKIDKSLSKEASEKSIIDMQKLYDSCIDRNNKLISRYKQKDQIRDTNHSKTQQNQFVLPLNSCIVSSEHTLRNKPFRESIRIYLGPKNSRTQDQKVSPDQKQKKKKPVQYRFFRDFQMKVKGQVKKLQSYKKGNKSNKLVIEGRQEDDVQVQYSHLLKSNLK